MASDSVMDAAHRIEARLPRRLYWGHTGAILLGERLARQGISPILDYVARTHELRLSSYVLVASGDMNEVMSAQTALERLPAKGIVELSSIGFFPEAQSIELIEVLGHYGEDPITGVVELGPPPGGSQPEEPPALQLAGTALFKRDKLWLSGRRSKTWP